MKNSFAIHPALHGSGLLILVLLTSTGCVALRDNAVPRTSPPLASSGFEVMPSMSYSFQFYNKYQVVSLLNSSENICISLRNTETLEREFRESMADSGCFGQIETNASANIRMELALSLFYEDKDLNTLETVLYDVLLLPIWQVSCAFTGFLIPAWEHPIYGLYATVRTSDGIERAYSMKDGASLVAWLPLFWLSYRLNPCKVYSDVRVNMYNSLLTEMQQDGCFSTVGAE